MMMIYIFEVVSSFYMLNQNISRIFHPSLSCMRYASPVLPSLFDRRNNTVVREVVNSKTCDITYNNTVLTSWKPGARQRLFVN